MKKYIPILFVLMMTGLSYAGMFPDYVSFFAPGIKIGYDFGNKSGVSIGTDLNINLLGIETGFWWTGLNFSVERNLKQKKWKFRQELIGGYFIEGVGIGSEYYDKKISFSARIITHGYFGYISYKLPIFKSYSQITIGGQLPFTYMWAYKNERKFGIEIDM
jgi:hypothetical protein